ncbi:MAG: hypothetical protein K6G18_12400 [Treponema sp.]|nr:hypothetical protein [Treponema sp.]
MKKLGKTFLRVSFASLLVGAAALFASCDYWDEDFYKNGGDTAVASSGSSGSGSSGGSSGGGSSGGSSGSSSGSGGAVANVPVPAANLAAVPQTQVAGKSMRTGDWVLVFNSSGTGGKIAPASAVNASYRSGSASANARVAKYVPGGMNAMTVDAVVLWIGEFSYNGEQVIGIVYQTNDNFTTTIKQDAGTGTIYFITSYYLVRKDFSSGFTGGWWTVPADQFDDDDNTEYFDIQFRANGAQAYRIKERGQPVKELALEPRADDIWFTAYENGVQTGSKPLSQMPYSAAQKDAYRQLSWTYDDKGILSGTVADIVFENSTDQYRSWREFLIYEGDKISYATSLTPVATLLNSQVL